MVIFKKKKFKLAKSKTSLGKTVFRIVNTNTGKQKEVDGVIAYSKKSRALKSLRKANG